MEDKELLDQQLKDLKETMLSGFRTIEKQITDLTLEVKAHNKAIAEQDKAIALANSDIKSLNNKIEEVAQKTDKNHDDIIKIQTEAAATKKTYNWLISLAGLGIAAINVIIRFID